MTNIIKPAATLDEWIKLPEPNPQALLRIFCFPFGGGGASFYQTWTDSLPPEIELCPVQLPGRENRLREQPFAHLPALVETLSQILESYLNMPFAFFGHSMGAWIGFELARQLRREKKTGPVQLFVSGRRAPQLPNFETPKHQLPKSEFIKELRRYNGTPELVLREPELMEFFLPLLRADFSILETYIYENEDPLNCSITAFGGIEDNKTSREDLEAWGEQTRRGFRLKMFPGDHFFLKSAREQLLFEIAKDLEMFFGSDMNRN
jgi:medium-chain acyl-[acyl-carrier-protein] hydrolase